MIDPNKMPLPAIILALIILIQLSNHINAYENKIIPPPKSTNLTASNVQQTNKFIEVKYLVNKPLRMNYTDYKSLDMVLLFDKDQLSIYQQVEEIGITFITVSQIPDFSILDMNGLTDLTVNLTMSDLKANKFIKNINIILHADYIGHANLILDTISLTNKYTNQTRVLDLKIISDENNLKVIITQYEGIWGLIFKISVGLLITISYINLGAQLDLDNMRGLIKKPLPLVLGLLISVFVMPIMTWFLSKWLLASQLIYRVGTFTFASGPAASASTLWAVMFDSDKELSVGLQVVSTFSALLTMPMLLYFMDIALESEGANYDFQSPYGRLISALLLVLIALLIGWYFIGRNPKGQKISRKIFKPLTFAILLFIIIYSSILYWHIFRLFTWTLTLTTFLITITTYLISGILGHLINCNKDTSIAISIGSTYKNSGIAFAVLLIAFEEPDLYIAYVPCLTQVLTTSLVLYIIYLFYYLFNLLRRRGQPEVIQATTSDGVASEQHFSSIDKPSSGDNKVKECRSNSTGSAKCVEENEELVAMNVTDSVPGSPMSFKQSETIHHTHTTITTDQDGADANGDCGGGDVC